MSSEENICMQTKLWKGIKNNSIVLFLCIIVITSWLAIYQYAFQKFTIENAIPVLGTIIQGMSALLGVSIAVMIFRIQSLENRKYLIEESIQNYISKIIDWAYPLWGPGLEQDIESGAIATRYLRERLVGDQMQQDLRERRIEDEEVQQRRLDNGLLSHRNITSLIKRIRTKFITSTIILGAPIFSSLLMLIATDALNREFTFIVVALNVLVSLIGIIILLDVIMTSTKEIL